MEHLGQIPMGTLTDREILLLTYQQLQQVKEAFERNKVDNDTQFHEVDKRLDAIEKKMQENDTIKAISDSKNQKLIKWFALGITAVQIIVSIILYLINKK